MNDKQRADTLTWALTNSAEMLAKATAEIAALKAQLAAKRPECPAGWLEHTFKYGGVEFVVQFEVHDPAIDCTDVADWRVYVGDGNTDIADALGSSDGIWKTLDGEIDAFLARRNNTHQARAWNRQQEYREAAR